MALEQLGNRGPIKFSVAQGIYDPIPHGVSSGVSEDVPCRSFRVLPNSERSFQMGQRDCISAVHGRVKHRQAQDLGLSPGSHSAEQTGLTLGQIRVDGSP